MSKLESCFETKKQLGVKGFLYQSVYWLAVQQKNKTKLLKHQKISSFFLNIDLTRFVKQIIFQEEAICCICRYSSYCCLAGNKSTEFATANNKLKFYFKHVNYPGNNYCHRFCGTDKIGWVTLGQLAYGHLSQCNPTDFIAPHRLNLFALFTLTQNPTS